MVGDHRNSQHFCSVDQFVTCGGNQCIYDTRTSRVPMSVIGAVWRVRHDSENV
jgi:hypothetical protein